jgi:uncharacterized protein (TIGR03437 family)
MKPHQRISLAATGGLIALANLLLLDVSPAFAQVQANAFFDDSHVQVINLTMDPTDWATFQQNYTKNTYYHATFNWNGITEQIGVRSHGGGSRSPVKPNLDVNFAHYDKSQTFLGLPFVLLKANNEDPSNLKEWLSMKLFRKMGFSAPREAPAQVFLNGQLLGFYFIVEHEDETFLNRNFGESAGYFYEWQQNGSYEFQSLGSDPNAYASLVDLKTNQPAPDLQNLANLIAVINQPNTTDDQFITTLSAYINPAQFITHIAIESALAEADGICGGEVGMNNFFLYQFNGQTLYQLVPWDKDNTFSDINRDIMYGITTGDHINLLAQRLVAIPQYRALYLTQLAKAENILGGEQGWADQEISREYAIIYSAAIIDPNKQCADTGVLAACSPHEFETTVQWLHTFLAGRYQLVENALAAAQTGPSSPSNPISISALGTTTAAISPGGLSTITGSGLGATAEASGIPLPRLLGSTFVAINGVRAPLLSTADGVIQFEAPGDLPLGTADVVVAVDGIITDPTTVTVASATPSILAVVHADGSPVSPAAPPMAGETLSIYATGLGAVTGTPDMGEAAPTTQLATTIATPQVTIASQPANVTFSGLVPNYTGLYQLNVVVPATWAADSSQLGLVITEDAQSISWQSN